MGFPCALSHGELALLRLFRVYGADIFGRRVESGRGGTVSSRMRPAAARESQSFVLHPICFGLFPLFSLLSANLVWASFREVFLPAGVVSAVTATLWLGLWPLVPQPHKRGLVVSLFWLPFFGYGTLVDGLRGLSGSREMAGTPLLLGICAVCLFAAAAVLILLRKAPCSFRNTTRVLNRFSALALCISLLACGVAVARRPAPAPVAETAPPDLSLPDIFYIICDAYPRSDHLRAYFDVDNSPFLGELRDRGFYVAERSRSNYGNTQPSLASTLNLDYIRPEWVPKYHYESVPELYGLVRDSLAVKTLKQHGYAFVDLTLGLFGGDMPGADRVVRPRLSPYTEYQQYLIDMTPVRSVLNRLAPLRSHHLVPFALDTLAELERGERPIFVYAHLYAPHVPHSYGKDGRVLASVPPYKEGMRNVVSFLDTRLVEVVDALLAREPNSVIVIQGDHGCNACLQCPEDYAAEPRTWEDYVKDRSANLSAFYFPDRNYQGLLYPEITPVNTFRILFNKYLGADFPLLEDASYLRAPDTLDIVRITDVY